LRLPNPRRLPAVLLLLLTLLTGSAPATAGTAAPDWPPLAGLSGKVVLVDFWASWCGPCLRSFPWMNELQQRHAGEGLVIVAVNLDQDRALADAFIKKLPPKFRVEFDPAGAVATQFGVQAMPTSFLVDRRGQVRARHAGFRDALRVEREQQIQQLLKETPP
jgi:thiol-disulfide isomerase/thioredoxin